MTKAMSRFVDVPWGQVHVRTSPPPISGPPALLLHQSPLSSRTYATAVPALAPWCSAIAIDTPGYGASSPPPEPWSIEQYADAVWTIADSLELEEVVMVGQHTGATIAVAATLARPERVSALVLHGLAYYSEEERAQRAAEYAPPHPIQSDGSHLLVIWDRIHRIYPFIDPILATALVHDYLSADPDYAAGYRAVFEYDIRAAVAALPAIPTLLITGSRDVVHRHQASVAAALTDAEAVTLQDRTDFAPLEDPQQFATVVGSFVRDNTRVHNDQGVS